MQRATHANITWILGLGSDDVANNTISLNRCYLTLGIGTIHGRNNNEHKAKKKVKTNILTENMNMLLENWCTWDVEWLFYANKYLPHLHCRSTW